MVLTSLAAVSVAFLVSASVSMFAIANLFVALPFVFMMVRPYTALIITSVWFGLIETARFPASFQVFGGFLVDLNSMLSWLSWLKWFSIFKYGLDVSGKGKREREGVVKLTLVGIHLI